VPNLWLVCRPRAVMADAREGRAERAAARGALATLVFEQEAAAAASAAAGVVLPSFASAPEYLAWPRALAAAPGGEEGARRREQLRPCGASLNDLLGATAVALDAGAPPIALPRDRLATTLMFNAYADGNTVEATHQRAMHKHTSILQGAYTGVMEAER
jgi:hypothetical protein